MVLIFHKIKKLERVYFENLYFYDPSKYYVSLKLENLAPQIK